MKAIRGPGISPAEVGQVRTPWDAPQVPSTCCVKLKVLSGENGASHVKSLSNSLEVDQLQRRGEQGSTRVTVRVFVVSMQGHVLMPTSPRGARILLKSGKAKIKTHNPFTIQLFYPTGESTQPIVLGIDPGFKEIGFSAISAKEELISGVVSIRQDVKKKKALQKGFRRNRRSRLWYRKPRFLNRTSKHRQKLAPSINYRVLVHENLIKRIKTFLPITQVKSEENKFDTQKIENSEIKGVEYQHGTLFGLEVKEYLLSKFNHQCVYCQKKNVPLEVDHLIPRSRNGSNRISNLVLACHDCNQKKGSRTAEEFGFPEIQKQAKVSLASATQTSIISKKLSERSDVVMTPGYETKFNRIQKNLEKSHENDAFIIAGGFSQKRTKPFLVSTTRRDNRKLRQYVTGKSVSIRKERHKIHSNDLVRYQVKGESKPRLFRVVETRGETGLVLIDEKLKKNRYPNVNSVCLVSSGVGLLFC